MTLQTLERKLKPAATPIRNPLLRWLYLNLPPQPITGKKMLNAYNRAVTILMKEIESGSIETHPRHEIEKYLSTISQFVDQYEKKEFSIESSTPEEMLRFLMEQHGLSQYDIGEDLGGQSVVSEILNGKRQLTREQIERLSRRFHIHPATFYSH